MRVERRRCEICNRNRAVRFLGHTTWFDVPRYICLDWDSCDWHSGKKRTRLWDDECFGYKKRHGLIVPRRADGTLDYANIGREADESST